MREEQISGLAGVEVLERQDFFRRQQHVLVEQLLAHGGQMGVMVGSIAEAAEKRKQLDKTVA